MIIYNVTSNVADDIHQAWLSWMTEEHIPQVLATGAFYEVRLIKVRGDEAHGGFTYSIQYNTESQQKLDEYYNTHAPALRRDVKERFGDKVLQFRTELEIIRTFKP